MMDCVKVTDKLGRIYVVGQEGGEFQDYCAAAVRLKELMYSELWASVVSGVYLNCIRRQPYGLSLRLSYLTQRSEKEVVEVYQSFALQNGLKTLCLEGLVSPTFSLYYGGDELAFRQYLAAYSLIGLDLLKEAHENTGRLFNALRQQPRAMYRSFLEPLFRAHSQYYKQLSAQQQDAFWKALISRYEGYTDWAHMMVNMMIGRDAKSVD